jgi:hypothetical protein
MTPTPESATRSFAGDDRALSSVVGKSLELGLLALYVSLLVSTFYGGVVPEYRTAVGGEVADRTVASVATSVEGAVPATDDGVVDVAVTHEVAVPETIRGDPYVLRLSGGALALDHPDDRLSRSVPLSLPPGVDRLAGEVRSGATVVVVVESTPDGLVVRLEAR